MRLLLLWLRLGSSHLAPSRRQRRWWSCARERAGHPFRRSDGAMPLRSVLRPATLCTRRLPPPRPRCSLGRAALRAAHATHGRGTGAAPVDRPAAAMLLPLRQSVVALIAPEAPSARPCRDEAALGKGQPVACPPRRLGASGRPPAVCNLAEIARALPVDVPHRLGRSSVLPPRLACGSQQGSAPGQDVSGSKRAQPPLRAHSCAAELGWSETASLSLPSAAPGKHSAAVLRSRATGARALAHPYAVLDCGRSWLAGSQPASGAGACAAQSPPGAGSAEKCAGPASSKRSGARSGGWGRGSSAGLRER